MSALSVLGSVRGFIFMGKKIEWPSKEEVYNLYIIKNLTRKDCATKLGISERLLKKIISVYEIRKDSQMAFQNYSKAILSKYRVDNPFKLPSTIKKSHAPEVEERRKASNLKTCLERYGQTHSITEEIKEKIKHTMNEKYNVDSYLEICQEKSTTIEVRQKAKETLIKNNRIKYGTDYWWQSDDFKSRFRSPEQVKQYKIKEIETKRKNGTLNSSKPEEELYLELCNLYGEEMVIRQYKEDRYPFFCDFYIKSEDLFIELNKCWTHGPHPFDCNSKEDLELLKKWEAKSVTSKFYSTAIYVWTELDVRKQNIAKMNGLNYKVIY